MGVLQLPGAEASPATAAAAAITINHGMPIAIAPRTSPPARNSPSPGRSTASTPNYISTTPVTSNVASGGFFHARAANGAPAAYAAGSGGVPAGNVGTTAFPTSALSQQQFSAAPPGPASFLQLPLIQPSAPYTNHAPQHRKQPQQMHVNQRGIAQQLQPSNAAANGINPPWNRIGGLQRGRSNTLLGTVTVGGAANANMNNAFGSRNRLGNLQGRGDGRSGLANKQSANMLGTVTVGGSRFGGAPQTRPPLLPMNSASSISGRALGYPPNEVVPENQFHQQSTLRGLPPTPNAKHVRIGPENVVVDYEEYHNGDGQVAATDYAPENSLVNGVPEVALTSDLVTLIVHEAATFDGVELALHPDVFTNKPGKKTSGGKDDAKKASNEPRLRPGDLVEIRVWRARPGVAVENASQSTSNSNAGPVAKSKMPSGPRPSLHSRNTSLATVSSSLTNASLMATPRTAISAKGSLKTTQQPPPLPTVVGGDGLSSFGASPDASSGKLYGENLIQLGTPSEQSQSATASNRSSVVAGSASNLFRMGASQGGNSEDSSSALSHSRDSSFVTTSTVGEMMHSRDSSLLTTSASWMNVLNGITSRDGTPQISPTLTTAAMEPVSEGMPQPHPLTSSLANQSTNASPESQVLAMRRDAPVIANSSGAGPPPPPRPPPSTGPTAGTKGSGMSTPVSHPSSPKIATPVSTPTMSGANATSSRNFSTSSVQRPPLVAPHSVDSTPSGSPVRQQSDSRSAEPAHTEPPFKGATPVHSRNHSIAMTGALAAVNNTLSAHRRQRSNATASSDTTSGTAVAKNSEGDVVKDMRKMLQGTHFVRVSFVMPVSEGSLSSIKSGARTQVSLLRQVADLFGITAYDTVTVTQVPSSKAPFVSSQIAADFLTLTFKDQFVSRGDMYNFQRQLLRDWVYEGKRLNFNGIRTNTKVIRHGDHVVRSGLISEETKLTFRSRSARIIWLVQMSSEMWDFASPFNTAGRVDRESACKIYFDKFVEFVRRLFDKWKKLQLTHNLTVIYFSRTQIRHREDSLPARSSSAVHVDSDGRMFEDHYKIVVENETNSDWDSLIHKMKKEFVKYPKEVGWDLTVGNERTPSIASQGNILEAVNITLNLLHLHYIDRDLHRTGNSIVIITPGSGVFEIDKNLAGITKQRMMDNGIGSDMVSLGLPPLHVAPFFLFKEKTTSTAEESQGFEEYKTYFEVPHWMNLSFVDYDNEDEEPMLYKEHLDDDETDQVNAVQSENEALAQSWHASNGFLKRHTPPNSFTAPTTQPDSDTTSKHHYKHLISDRGFEDILQACRPRSRGDYGSGLPESLTILLKKTNPNGGIETKDTADRHPRKTKADQVSQRLVHGEGMLTPQRATHASRSRFLEWGAVDFDEFTFKRSNNSHQPQHVRSRSLSGSQSSPGSSFASIGSYRIPSHLLLGSSHLQSTTSLDGGQSIASSSGDHHNLGLHHKPRHSDGSLVSLDDDESHDTPGIPNVGQSVSSIHQLMADHDKSTFSAPTKTNISKNKDISQSPDDSHRNSMNDSFGRGNPLPDESAIARPKSAMLPSNPTQGGIEAALVQYDVTKKKKEPASGPIKRAGLSDNFLLDEVAIGRPSMSTSPLGTSLGMPISLDRRSEGLRPSVMRLVAPDIIPSETKLGEDMFQPLESHRKNSFHTINIKTKSKEGGYVQSKMLAITKENRLGDRRHSMWEMLKDQGSKKSSLQLEQKTESGTTLSPMRAKSITKHSRKSHHRHYRRRRKQWVLNPFRQEDEDEVLAKRTHNRRRWSHVFPLGEDEFKRHAGPNWKSLCQPAILPLTIDFHPPPQDLEDRKKFTVKQYSVTLPPMGETTYKSHAELLDDLLIQRMRQDFQIVPRNIIQQTRREAADNSLEVTLSMGHKIQNFAYNRNTDSVDVVQYYARFAEDETPQTYRYLLWSSLQQDYVSVFQTFTKYTLPYKWNELDMLISGDTVTSIHEGMRYPRISFVIIPDPFNSPEEEEEYVGKFQRLMEYFAKISKDEAKNASIEMHVCSDASPRASSGDKRFIVDLRKKREDKYEWCEVVHDSNCDTRRTFRVTIQWLVAVASKIDQQSQLLHRRCTQYGLKLVSAPHFSCLRSCFMNPFAVPITKPIRNKSCVDAIEKALTDTFDFVYDGTHMADPNELDCLDGFDFVVNKWSIKKKKKFVPARQYLHRSGTIFTRLLRDTQGRAIIIIYLNQRHIAGDDQRIQCARTVFRGMDRFIVQSLNNVA